ncbi:MAG TPA: hypothetical protein VFB58_18785 [Chloroflexota bacterium]|nr:hypothetical protein [Chloroflexota bacterium]
MRLLSVDWDYFVPSIDLEFAGDAGAPVPYALSTGEYFSDDMLDALWDSRAAALLSRRIPLPGTSGEEESFWDRFSLAPDAALYYADSHAQAAHALFRAGISEVWNYDAHHDCGYEGALDDVERLGWVGCANWMCYYGRRGATLHVRYPAWRADAARRELEPLCPVDRAVGNDPPCRFDVVFVARSSAWTPHWLDHAFMRLLDGAPVTRRICLDRPWHRRDPDSAWIAHLQTLAP